MSKKKGKVARLCDWDKDSITRNLEQIGQIVGRPHFVCRKCARAAGNPIYLCKPTPLPAPQQASDAEEAEAALEESTT